MKTLEIPREGRTPSQIVIGEGLAQRFEEFVPKCSSLFVVTDSDVAVQYADLLAPYNIIIIGRGEKDKTLHTVEKIHQRLMEMGADRNSYIVGFGGGITTDVTGFVASTYMRGVGFGFVATSLLAQVDASVGGKNGVNLGGYKNMVGVFNQPDFVLCDMDVLDTLPMREFRAGMAEVIKSAVIDDAKLFELLEGVPAEELLANKGLLEEVVWRTVSVKARIVAQDEREGGVRRLLNLGHTIAHAIEKSSSLYVHGEAVAVGMAAINRVAVSLGVLSAENEARIDALLEGVGLPISCDVPVDTLKQALRKDKKGVGDSIHIVLPCEVGRCEVRTMTFEEFDTCL
ncbi:MAG: 3-dehydroquinate synthase [Rikenellaceae bacterium]|nr:3-dehydroquinate synthase [Rikenellaceae bacterium]